MTRWMRGFSGPEQTHAKGLLGFFCRYPFRASLIALTLCYLVWLVVFYPGCTNNDVNYQLR